MTDPELPQRRTTLHDCDGQDCAKCTELENRFGLINKIPMNIPVTQRTMADLVRWGRVIE
jgi:hypothetical protein